MYTQLTSCVASALILMNIWHLKVFIPHTQCMGIQSVSLKFNVKNLHLTKVQWHCYGSRAIILFIGDVHSQQTDHGWYR